MEENFWKFKNNTWIRVLNGKERASIRYCKKEKKWLCIVILGKSALIRKYFPTLFECSLWAEQNFPHKVKSLPTFFY